MPTPNSHPGLYRKGRYWYFAICINGQRYAGSTRVTDLATARRVLEEKRQDFVDSQLRRPSKVKPVEELVRTWLKLNKPTFSKGHWSSSECATRRWVVPHIGKLPANRVTNAIVLELRARMLEEGCSATYANNTLRTLRAIFNFAVGLGYLHEIPFKVKKLKVQKKPRSIVSARRVQAFLEEVDRSAQNPHIPVILRVMLGLGLREAEALGMRWEWFDLEHRTYVVGRAKGKEARVIPVPEWLWTAIYNMPKPLISEWVFPADDGQPHRAQFCKKALQRVCEKLELGNVTQHRLRATFASLHAEAGTPVPEIQAMLGHKSVQTTMIYIETSLDAKRRAQDALSLKLGLVSGGLH